MGQHVDAERLSALKLYLVRMPSSRRTMSSIGTAGAVYIKNENECSINELYCLTHTSFSIEQASNMCRNYKVIKFKNM